LGDKYKLEGREREREREREKERKSNHSREESNGGFDPVSL
jgi:hypothetical protein